MTSEGETARQFYDTRMYTQWLPPGEIEAYQQGQLSQLLHHTARTRSFYAERLAPPDT